MLGSLDPQLARFLIKLSAHDGSLSVDSEDLARQFDQSCADRAERMKLVRFATYGVFGARAFYELTLNGWQALGLDPPPSTAEMIGDLALRFFGLR